MAFNVGTSSKDAFKQLRKLTPRQRLDYVNNYSQGSASILSMLTPQQFAELFPNYFRKGLPDVSGFREAISRKSSQKQNDINFGLSQGAQSIEQAEQMGTWRRRFGNKEDGGRTSSTLGDSVGRGTASGYGSLSKHQVAAIIQEEAAKRGIDPKVALAIARSEGLNNYRSGAPGSKWGMDREPSYGPFQLLMGKGTGGPTGMGDDFYARTGIDPSKDNSPQSIKKQIEFALDRAKTNGWGAWYGRKTAGVGVNDGLSWSGSYTPGQYYKEASYMQTSMGDVSRTSTKSGGYYGNDEQCVALSKHFSGLGAASDWKVKSGNISAGTVIATMSYNDGSGGKMAKDMPDGKSHYHTGIALSAPNESGNVLILEQFAGQPARVRMININNYNGERWGVVDGGEPNAGTMKAVEIGRNLANPDQLALIGQPGTQQASAQVNPVQQAPTARPTAISTEQQQQYPADQQQSQNIANKQTANVEKVDKSKKTFESYKFDPDKYWNEVKTKQPMADSMFYGKDKVMQETYKGFEEAQAAGAIKWDKKTNELKILDPNHEKVQQIYKDMKDHDIDRNAFLSKTEAGGSGTAKVSKGNRRHSVRDSYAPEVTSSGLNKDSKLIDYRGSIALNEIGISQEQLNAIREAKASIESSGGKYDLRGGSSKRFSGAYQMGGNEIKMAAKVLGEQAPVVAVRKRKTPIASDEFLNNPQMQERYHEAFLVAQHRSLMKNKAYAAMSPEKRSEILGFAHNAGAGGASRYLKTGHSKADAFGTQPQKFASHVRTQLSGLQMAQNIEAEAKTKLAATPARSTPGTAGPGPTTSQASNAPQPKSTFGLDYLDPYTHHAAASAVATGTTTPKQTSPSTSKPEAIQRSLPEGPASVTTVPPGGMTPETMQPAPNRFEQDVMRQVTPEKPQKETIIDASLNRQTREFPTSSLERAMGKARGFETGTGADGHHHSTTSLG